ncbi:2-oxoacid:acceptor oxidoreductase family protein [Patescibacteria group bacterium]|nr:2-oxoacid:acceptor oxidoreductase family protein [Patescibacteria group bacterium]
MTTSENQIGVKWYGRAGHGAVSAGEILGLVFAAEGWQVQAFPDFGAEKRGAPLTVFNRLSKNAPIRLNCNVQELDYVIVLDSTLLRTFDVTKDLKPDGIILINTDVDHSNIAKVNQKVYSVPASKIALEEIGKNIPNIPLIGAFAKVSGIVDIDNFTATVEKALSDKFPQKIVDGNMRAFKRALKEVSS